MNGSIVLGSNIYELQFLDDLFLYQSDPINDTLPYKEGTIISPKKLNFPEIPIKRADRGLIAMAIISAGLKLFEYPMVGDDVIINPFELQIKDGIKSLPALRFRFIDREVPSICLDVRKLYFSVDNCSQIIQSLQKQGKDVNEHFQDKYVRTRYTSKKWMFKIKRVLFEQEIEYKGELLQNYMKRKQRMVSQNDILLETYDQSSNKTQYLLADFCELELNLVEQDCSSYCQQLLYWNSILNSSSDFMAHIKKYKLIIEGYNLDFKINYLDSGTMCFANNVNKQINQIIFARTQSEFTHFYGDFFLKGDVTFTTNLKVDKLMILVNRDTVKDREHFKQFLEKWNIQSKKYKIVEPQIFDIQNNNINELVEQYVQEDAFVLIVADKDYPETRRSILNRGINVQSILLPIVDQEINRILGIMVAKIGSVPWSIRELNGYLQNHNKKIAVLGVQQILKEYSCVLSINKQLNKYISTFGTLQDSINKLIGTYYATHKMLPELLVIICQNNLIQLIDTGIDSLIKLIQQQNLATIIPKPELCQIQTQMTQTDRYFTYQEKYLEPRFCRNPGIGMQVILNEKKGFYALHTLRGGQGTPLAHHIHITGQVQYHKELLQLYYQLIFICFDFNSNTFLPAPLHYAIQLAEFAKTQQGVSPIFLNKIQLGHLLYI